MHGTVSWLLVRSKQAITDEEWKSPKGTPLHDWKSPEGTPFTDWKSPQGPLSISEIKKERDKEGVSILGVPPDEGFSESSDKGTEGSEDKEVSEVLKVSRKQS